jgi:hypothetical protein
MDHEQEEKAIARKSAQIYLPIALGMASLFLLISSLVGAYPPVARLGGTVWVATLTLIISMPVVTSWLKKLRRDDS